MRYFKRFDATGCGPNQAYKSRNRTIEVRGTWVSIMEAENLEFSSRSFDAVSVRSSNLKNFCIYESGDSAQTKIIRFFLSSSSPFKTLQYRRVNKPIQVLLTFYGVEEQGFNFPFPPSYDGVHIIRVAECIHISNVYKSKVVWPGLMDWIVPTMTDMVPVRTLARCSALVMYNVFLHC